MSASCSRAGCAPGGGVRAAIRKNFELARRRHGPSSRYINESAGRLFTECFVSRCRYSRHDHAMPAR